MCLSAMVIPVFLDTDTETGPTHLLRQWTRLYHYGHMYMPALSVATCGIYGVVASSKYGSNSKQWLVYAAAAVTTIAIVPFTWFVMAPTNNILFRLESSTSYYESASGTDMTFAQELVVKWSRLHSFRSIFPLVGAILGFIGILQELGW